MWSRVLRSVTHSRHMTSDVLSFLTDEEQGEGLQVGAMCRTKTQKEAAEASLGHSCIWQQPPVFLKWGSCFNIREIIRMWEATRKLRLCSAEGFGQQFQTHSNPVSATLAQASDVVMLWDLYRARYSVFIGVHTNNTAVQLPHQHLAEKSKKQSPTRQSG